MTFRTFDAALREKVEIQKQLYPESRLLLIKTRDSFATQVITIGDKIRLPVLDVVRCA